MFACLFDIDGTLLSSGGAGKDAMYAAIMSEFQVREVFDGVPFAGRTDRAIARDLFHRHGIDETPENWNRFVDAYLGHLPQSLQKRQGQVLPGVVLLIEKLRARGDIALGLLTGNTRRGAQQKLAHYGIDHHFQFGGYGDNHYDRNDVACEALAALHQHVGHAMTGERVWVIGDTPLDVRCARAIGARVLAVCTGFHCHDDLIGEKPDLLLTDLSDVTKLLACLV